MAQKVAEHIVGPMARAAIGHGEAKAIISTRPKPAEGAPPMKATTWHGKHDVRVSERPRPAITDPEDIILKVTSTCICGSDLHLYEGVMPGMVSGDILGHEFMGIVEEAGPDVRAVKKGDRVVVCFDIACGNCGYCKRGMYSCCACTNPSAVQEGMYGQRTGGFFGYSHLLGAYDGGQSEYVRVPLANTMCLKIPAEHAQLPDERFVLLSDILPTAWHACKMGEVGGRDRKNVAIWGAGPVGMLAAMCAKHMGAENVVVIDKEVFRLEYVSGKFSDVKTINYSKSNVHEELRKLFPEMGGPDVVIEAVGFHYVKSLVHQVEQKLGLETDTSEVLNELIRCVRKGGVVSVIGVYAGLCNHFAIGAFMEKSLTMRGGQTPCQRYWPELLPHVVSGVLDPSWVITHVLPLEQVSHAYKIFNNKTDGCVKVVLKPAHAREYPAGPGSD